MGTASRTSTRNAAGTSRGAEGVNEQKRPDARASGPARTRTEAAKKGARSDAPRGATISMTSTEAKNGFGRVLDAVARNGRVLITKHNTTRAVVLSPEEYEELTRGPEPSLDTLSAEFDELLARMQTPEARAGLRDAFRESPDVLSRAAVAAAQGHAPEK